LNEAGLFNTSSIVNFLCVLGILGHNVNYAWILVSESRIMNDKKQIYTVTVPFDKETFNKFARSLAQQQEAMLELMVEASEFREAKSIINAIKSKK